jgi:hypothetical protein
MSVDVKMRRVNTFEYDRCRLKYVYSTGRKINKHKIYFFLILDIMHCEFESLTRLYTCYLYTVYRWYETRCIRVVYTLYRVYFQGLCIPWIKSIIYDAGTKGMFSAAPGRRKKGFPIGSRIANGPIIDCVGQTATQHNQKSHRKTACNLQLDEANEPNASGD